MIQRDSEGKFAKGNQEGRKFREGEGGRPKGSRNRRTIVAKQFAEDVLHLNPETGEEMTCKELTLYIARKADTSPRIPNLLVDHYLGKPVEKIQVEEPQFLISKEEKSQH